ncbi:LADA_0H19570g1_1 [Lachancea dasiensis]|uniref:LADA_0H19570g1_1 n=1 Tax=Lachancea dasiensis TaxID=1072105 RepID=A0A1G4K6I3_9SACH|nr:LADA_0H19570g1_1 [Lachancea dasiensis]
MAPFKFAKKGSKDKAKQDAIAEAKPVIPPPNPKRFMQSEKPAISNIPEPVASRIHPTPVPVQQRNVSSASALHQAEYEPWKRIKLTNSPFPRYRHVASAYMSDQNQVFVIGGLHDQSVYGDTWIISAHENGTRFSSKTVEIGDSTPPPRVGHASTLCGNAFVIFGGDTHKVNSEGLMDDDVYLFNINSYKWTIPRPVGPRPLGRYGHKISIIATSQMKTKLYVFGGQFDDTYFNDLSVFDLSSFRRPDSHWQFIKPNTFTPPPLTNHTMISYDFKLWVFGGDTPQGLVNDLFMYDPQLNDWKVIETTGTSPPPLQEHAAVLCGKLMCVVGGKDEQDVYSNDVYFLNLVSLKWFKFPYFKSGIPQGRSGHSLTLLPNNTLLIMGGDKFDYSRPHEDDFHTSDVDTGHGTILYTLDLGKLKEHCPGIFDYERLSTPQKFANRDAASPQLTNRSFSGGQAQSQQGHQAYISQQQQNILTPFSEKYQTPRTDQGDFALDKSTPKADHMHTPGPISDSGALPNPQTFKKPTSPVPQLKPSQLGAQSPPPRVVSLSSANESDINTSRGYDSQLSGETSDEYGVAMIGNSPSKPVVRESIIPESATLENLGDRTVTDDLTPKSDDFADTTSPSGDFKAESTVERTSDAKSSSRELIDALRKELTELRAEAENNAQSASQKITSLELENSKLKDSSNIGTRFIKLQTDYDITIADKKAQEDRVSEVEDLLSKKFLDVARLHDIIRAQSDKIEQFGDQESFKEKYEELLFKYEHLLKEHESIKAVDREDTKNLHSSINQYSVQLQDFLSQTSTNDNVAKTRSVSEHHQGVIDGLRARVETMTVEREESAAAAQNLSESYKSLQEKNRLLEQKVEDLEQNYEHSVNSVNNASRALELSQADLNKFKQDNKRLADELEELKYKSPDYRDVSITSVDESIASSGAVAASTESKNDMRAAPYRLKINDLKAELFIIKQERDSLNENLMELKKKLLNLENEDD